MSKQVFQDHLLKLRDDEQRFRNYEMTETRKWRENLSAYIKWKYSYFKFQELELRRQFNVEHKQEKYEDASLDEAVKFAEFVEVYA